MTIRPSPDSNSLAHRRNVSALSLFYRYYHDRCFDELKSVIRPKECLARSTHFVDSQHTFAVKLENFQASSFANMFVPTASRNWKSLPASVFLNIYNLQNPGAETPTPTFSFDQFFLLFGNARDFRDPLGVHLPGPSLLNIFIIIFND